MADSGRSNHASAGVCAPAVPRDFRGTDGGRKSNKLLILLCFWWAHKGSNLGPLPCEGNALPLSYAPGIFRARSKTGSCVGSGNSRRQTRRFTKCGLQVSSWGETIAAPRVRQNASLSRRINVIWVVQSPRAKIFRYARPGKSSLQTRAIPPRLRGALRGRHERWVRDAVDALAAR